MARKIKKLDQAISISIVSPVLTDEGWRFGGFPGATEDHLHGAAHMHQVYTRADPRYTGRATVPVLWDKKRDTIVNNESADILRILNAGFGDLADNAVDLYPEPLRAEIDALNEQIYPRLNNGVYRAGFATTQEAYEEAFHDVFGMLDELEARLATRTWLVGERLTEADIRLFVTLIRFDAAYHGAFKCNLRRIVDYPALDRYVARVLAIPGARETVDLDHVKRGYYSIKSINPNGITPLGPAPRWI